MPAVVRVKRHINEEPLGTFMLRGKKRRLNTDEEITAENVASHADSGEVSTILKFAGTMKIQDGKEISRLAKLTKESAVKLISQKCRKPADLTTRAREEMRQALHENRFHVVNCRRATLNIDDSDDDDDEGAVATVSEVETKDITIVDVEKTISANVEGATSSTVESTSSGEAVDSQSVMDMEMAPNSDSDSGFVYDLYLPENEQQAQNVDLMEANYLSVRAFDDIIYEERYVNEESSIDSEDSNHEDYYKNDYPEEEENNGSIASANMCSSDDSEIIANYETKMRLRNDYHSNFDDVDSNGNSSDDHVEEQVFWHRFANSERESSSDEDN